MRETESVFTKLNTRVLRERVLSHIVGEAKSCVIQLEDKSSIIVEVVSRSGASMDVKFPDDKTLRAKQRVLLSFSVDDVKYFIKSQISPGLNNIHHFDTTADIYKLQRRDNFRVQIPLSWQGGLHLSKLNMKEFKCIYPLFDLSSGGLSFEIPMEKPIALEAGDEITGKFEITERMTMEFSGEIKHIKDIGSRGSGLKRAGVMFTTLDNKEESKIIEILMELHREVFSRLKKS